MLNILSSYFIHYKKFDMIFSFSFLQNSELAEATSQGVVFSQNKEIARDTSNSSFTNFQNRKLTINPNGVNHVSKMF